MVIEILNEKQTNIAIMSAKLAFILNLQRIKRGEDNLNLKHPHYNCALKFKNW